MQFQPCNFLLSSFSVSTVHADFALFRVQMSFPPCSLLGRLPTLNTPPTDTLFGFPTFPSEIVAGVSQTLPQEMHKVEKK